MSKESKPTGHVTETAAVNLLSPRELKIVKLNQRVAKLTLEAVQEANNKHDDLPLYIKRAQKKLTPIVAGAPVYQIRLGHPWYICSAWRASS